MHYSRNQPFMDVHLHIFIPCLVSWYVLAVGIFLSILIKIIIVIKIILGQLRDLRSRIDIIDVDEINIDIIVGNGSGYISKLLVIHLLQFFRKPFVLSTFILKIFDCLKVLSLLINQLDWRDDKIQDNV